MDKSPQPSSAVPLGSAGEGFLSFSDAVSDNPAQGVRNLLKVASLTDRIYVTIFTYAGREIGYCDGTREEAEALRDAIFGDGIIPSADYEEPKEEE